MLKKLSTILLAVMMLLSMSFAVSAANDGTVTIEWAPTKVYYEADGTNLFDVNIAVDGPATVGMYEFTLNYDSTVVVPVKADGTEIASAADTVSTFHSNFVEFFSTIEAEEINYCGIVKAGTGVQLDVPADGVIFTLKFKALKVGESAMTITSNYMAVNGVNEADKWTLTNNTDASTIKVYTMPSAPTVSEPVLANVKSGSVAELTYDYTDGSVDTEDADDSDITWTVDGEEVDPLVDDEKKITIDDEWVGKKLKATVVAKASRPVVADGNTVEVEALVMPADDYMPVINTVTLPAESTATKEIVPVVTYTETYEGFEADTYKWYIVSKEEVDTALGAEAETATEEARIAAAIAHAETEVGVQTTATATYGAEYLDDYAVVVVTPAVKVGTETYPKTGTPVSVKAATKVFGQPADWTVNAKLADKKLYLNNKVTINSSDMSAKSNNVTNASVITYTYEWAIVANKYADVAALEAAIEAKEVVLVKSESNSFKIEKENAEKVSNEGKYLVLRATAFDYDNIPAVTYVIFNNAITKAPASGSVQTGASLVTGGNTVVTPEKPGTEDPEKPGTEDPGTDEPGTEEPAGSEDPAGTANEAGVAAFTDVDKEAYAWAYDSIDVLAKAGVIKGMTETSFGPELTTTNAQVIALAVRIAGLTAEEGATTDKVDAEHWVAGEMAIAEANEILGVYGDKLDVEGETTREVAFTLLYNALKAAGVELAESAEAIEFTDAASISEGCVEAINALVKADIVHGMGDGTLAPKATITRAQLAKILGLANALIK